MTDQYPPDYDALPFRWDPSIPPRPSRLIEVAHLGPGVLRILHQSRGASDD